MEKLYILTGLPFSGKSTLIDAISKQTDVKAIAFDKFWVELEKSMNDEEKAILTYEYVTSLLDKRIAELLKDGQSVIYDSLNDTRDQRDRLRAIASKTGAEGVVIYLNTPIDLIQERRKANDENPTRHTVDEENFTKSVNKFVAPEADENFIEFLPSDDLTTWIRENIAD